jgi:diguanylate cyclase (GGDEF)-like protein/PAS domain S-box-containing protein
MRLGGRRATPFPIGVHLVIAIALVAAAATAALLYGRSALLREAHSRTVQQATFASRQAAGEVSAAWAQFEGQVGELAAVPGLSSATPAGCTLSFARVGPFTTGRYAVLDPEGVAICTSDSTADARTYVGAPWLGRTTIGSRVQVPTVDPATGQPALVATKVITGGFTVVGILDLDTLATSLASSYGGPQHLDVDITTPSGASLSRSDAAAKERSLPRFRGRTPATGLALVVEVSALRSKADAEANRVFLREALIVYGGVLVTFVVGGFVARRGRRAEKARAEVERGYRQLFADNPQPMWLYDLDTLAFLDVNDAAVAQYGYSRDEFLAMTIRDIRPPDDVPALEASVRDRGVLDRSGPWRHTRRSGEVIEVDVSSHELKFEGRRARFVMAEDVTQRLAHERALQRLALTDELTGLPNRTVVLDRLAQALGRADGRQRVGMIAVDLDRFRHVNERFGQAGGDALLKQVSDRLASVVGTRDTLGRLGADEFVVLCQALRSETDAVVVAERMSAALSGAFTLDGHELFIRASSGITLEDGERSAEELLRDAVSAMHRAKERGGAGYEIFDPAVQSRRFHELEIERRLRRAVERDELRLWYQPELELRDERIHGVEALLRWERSEGEIISPLDFIPIAERTGLIAELGEWVLHEACRQAAEWQRRSVETGLMSVNVSARQLAESELAVIVARALDEADLEPERLCLELTESALMADPTRSLDTLRAIRRLGVSLSIDDFGTGYSSLEYLRRYPVQYLKIDRSFVKGVMNNPYDVAIVKGVIDLGHAFDLKIVAEGVETPAQLARLRASGCDLGQGYLWSAPVPAERLERLPVMPSGSDSATVR